MTLIHELTLREPPVRRGWDAPLGLRVALAGLTIYLLLVGANLATPLYPHLREQMHLSATDTSVAFTAYVLSLIVGLLCASHWSDHMGRRAVLVTSVVIGLAGALVFMFAGGLSGLVLGRALQGIAVSLATGSSAAAVRELLADAPETATRVTLLSSSGGVASGPLLGGWLSGLGDPVLVPFWTHVVSLVLVLVPLIILNARPARQRVDEHGRRIRVLMPLRPTPPKEAKRIFFLTSATGFLSFCMFGFFLSLAPSYYAGVLGSSRMMIGVMAALVLGSSAVAQLMTIKPKHRGFVGLCAMTLGLGIVLLWGAESRAALFAGSVLAGLGQGTAFRTLFTHMAASVPLTRHATTISLMYVITYLGSALPILALGQAIDHWGRGVVPAFIGAMTLAAAILALWTRFEPEPPKYVHVEVLESEVENQMADEPPHV